MTDDVIDDPSPRNTSPALAVIPDFLLIKSSDIERWAVTLPTRFLLPVLLRKLIHSTGRELRQVDFPGYDNAERHGNDGYVETDASTPWIPKGRSYWEFGTNEDVKTKANNDYAARIKSIDKAERSQSTFVFVTPRIWKGKASWEAKQKARGDWKDVRVFDASDLEQWLEQSIPAQVWIAEQCGRSTQGTATLAAMWEGWSGACNPKLSPLLFSKAVAVFRESFITWLNTPPSKPFLITADSRSEGLAFLHCLFDTMQDSNRDRGVVVQSRDALRMLVTSPPDCILILDSDDLARELGASFKEAHTILVMSRGVVSGIKPDIALGILDTDTFHQALDSMGINHSRISRLIRESGLSPTILRRRLAINPSIQKPLWANASAFVQKLLPLVFAGAWVHDNSADQEILRFIAGSEYSVLEKDMSDLLQQEDSPVWSIGLHRGVVSQLDALFIVKESITASDLSNFLIAAEYVLSETDPSLSLPADARWAAPLYGKIRQHSPMLRQRICQMLVLLAVYGNSLFLERLGVDIEYRIAGIIHNLLTPLTLEKLNSCHTDLPLYAEAAPHVVLSIFEADLKDPQPVLYEILQSYQGFIFSSSSRTGVLWALEYLAWKRDYFMRAVLILAQLSQYKLADNLVNKPEHSLMSIFRAWMPQTTATVEERVTALMRLKTRFPDLVWAIGIAQLQPVPQIGHFTYKPQWRNDAFGFGDVVSSKERHYFNRYALDLLLDWPSHNETTLQDLVRVMGAISFVDQIKIWDLIVQWSYSAADNQKAFLHEHIRCMTLKQISRNHRLATLDALVPTDIIDRYWWLFRQVWVPRSSEEKENDEFNHNTHFQRIDRLRLEALDAIWQERGFNSITDLLATGYDADTLGRCFALYLNTDTLKLDFIQYCLSIDSDTWLILKPCIQGFLSRLDAIDRSSLLTHDVLISHPDKLLLLLLAAPFDSTTWCIVNMLDETFRNTYWKEVNPSSFPQLPDAYMFMIEELIKVQRPRIALKIARSGFNSIETTLLKRLLQNVVLIHTEGDAVLLDPNTISYALDALSVREDITVDEMAWLEYSFIYALDGSHHGIPYLEQYLTDLPERFVQAVVSSEDSLLIRVRRIPGMGSDGSINASQLIKWMTEIRDLCGENGHLDIADHYLGMLLSHAPADDNRLWPCAAVCQAIEAINSDILGDSFMRSTINNRNEHGLSNSVGEERAYAAKYSHLADRLLVVYPIVSGILRNIALFYNGTAGWLDSEGEISARI